MQKIINLLPNRFKKMDCSIYDFRNSLHVDLYLGFTTLNVYDGNKDTTGIFNNDKKVICCYHYRTHNKKYMKLQAAYTLIHELRHCYQSYYFKSFKKAYDRYAYKDYDDEIYDNQWIEIDANKFAKKFMLKYRDELNKIFRINYYWDINEH